MRLHLSFTIETGPPAPDSEPIRETSIESLVENRVGFIAAPPVDTGR